MRGMAEAGATIDEIARALGVPEKSAQNRLARDGVSVTRRDGCKAWTPDEVKRLKGYMRDGTDSRTVARRMGRTLRAVYSKREWVNKHGGCWE